MKRKSSVQFSRFSSQILNRCRYDSLLQLKSLQIHSLSSPFKSKLNPLIYFMDGTEIPSKSKLIRKRKEKKLQINDQDPPRPSSPSVTSSSCSTSHDSRQRGFRLLSSRRKKTRVLIGENENDVLALALPLGMSIAAVVAQVLEKKHEANEHMSVDHLASICTLAVRESLANVFGDKFDSFASNFEKSFRSTLLTLRLINESSQNHRNLTKSSCFTDTDPSTSVTRELDSAYQSTEPQKGHNTTTEYDDNFVRCSVQESIHNSFMNFELANRNCRQDTDSIDSNCMHDEQMGQQLVSVSSNNLLTRKNVLTTFQKSVMEQTRSNNLKAYELGLTLKKLKLKETQLELNSDMNFLERCKLSMGISKASFKADKFKNQLEDSRFEELLKKCIDCLVAGLLIMLSSLGYGAYIFSHHRITEVTAACTPKESKPSWWVPNPMASFNSGIQVIMCHVQVGSRILFGVLMILTISFLLFQRASSANRTMPITFLLLLGVACGYAGKFCVDALGGSGYLWLKYWESICSIHFFSNTFTKQLYSILHGPIVVTEVERRHVIVPFWVRRVVFYLAVVLVLPVLCGFSPFAGFDEWKNHFTLVLLDV